MILLELFWSFFQIGILSFGGGYAVLPLIQSQIVEYRQWLTLVEYADILTISQMTPGPIAINAATFVGTRVAGLPGAVIATLGCITPSLIIALGVAYLYVKYRQVSVMQGILSFLRPAVVALIASAGISIVKLTFWGGGDVAWAVSALDFVAIGLFTASLVILRKWKTDPIKVMLASGVVGAALYLLL